MIALLTYPAAKFSDPSPAVRKSARRIAFSDEVWKLHGVIANPLSCADEVLIAKRQLLRRLRKSKPAAVSRESRRGSIVRRRFSENDRLAGGIP
jgi:hypothetical protein